MLDLTRALRGVQVVEVASYIPGPLCTAILAGLGAEVTKIERPGGDPMRTLPPVDGAGRSPVFALLNRGKRCLELNLRAADDLAQLRALLAGADVLVDGLRPGALGRLGLGDDALLAGNPRLIIGAIGGFGPDDARRADAGHDLNFQALAGLLAAGELPPQVPGAHAADMVSGLTAAAGVLAALLARGPGGAGGRVEVPMLGAARWLLGPALAVAAAGLAADTSLAGGLACYRLYPTADGRHLAVAALEHHFWVRVCGAIGRPDMAGRQHDADQAGLIGELGAIFASQPLGHWEALLGPLDACVSPVRSPGEVAAEAPITATLAVAGHHAPR